MNIDLSNSAHIRVQGDDRFRFLQGMCTSNVAAMQPGEWLRTMMLSPKGRVLALFEVLAEDDALRILCDASIGEKLMEALDSHIIADDVELTLESIAAFREFKSHDSFWNQPYEMGPSSGDTMTPGEVEIRRIEAGFPRYGVDVGEKDFPFESGLAQYIDYKKGCYVGQEPVARVFYKGAPQRVFRGLLLSEGEAATEGTPFLHEESKRKGLVTSSCLSPRLGPIALAYLHRSIAVPGTLVSVGGVSARVCSLPFG